MEELVKYIVSKLADDPSVFEVTSENENEKTVIIRIQAEKQHIGKVIGHNGKIANAIRTIVKSMSLKEHKRYIVKISEKESV